MRRCADRDTFPRMIKQDGVRGTGNFHADAMSIVVPQNPSTKRWVFHPAFERDSAVARRCWPWVTTSTVANPGRSRTKGVGRGLSPTDG